MSYSIDVNILLYSSDLSSPFHAKALAFLDACTRREESIYLCYLTLMSYMRMSTHPRLFTDPLTPGEALDNIERLAKLPQVRLISEREGFLELYSDVTQDSPLRGNLVPDGHLASVLRQHGVPTLYTNNVDDFRRFDFLEVRNPLS